jgi:uncharacterized protein (DUF1330 family)
MKAYIIVDVDSFDTGLIEEYRKLTPATLLPFDGKFIVRGGSFEVLEGDWNPKRIVVVEFPSKELAKAWWESEIYAKAKAIRQRAAYTKMLLVEGVA